MSARQHVRAATSGCPVEVAVVDTQPLFGKPAWRAHCRKQAKRRSEVVRKAHEVRLAGEVLAIVQAQGIETVGLYEALGVEVSTRELANLLVAHGHRLAYPRLRNDDVTVDYCRADGPAFLLKRPRSRLMEPAGPVLSPAEIGLIVVPAMAVDGRLRRLGRGGGSYDRYLPQLPDCTARIAAVSASSVVAWGPVESHDVALDAVCTERGLFGACPAP